MEGLYMLGDFNARLGADNLKPTSLGHQSIGRISENGADIF